MGGAALKLPAFKLPSLNLPRPLRWDWIALGVLLVGVVLTGLNFMTALSRQPGEPMPGGLTPLFVVGQLAVACGGLMVLGKTAKEGTAWGNLFSLLAMFVGMSGVLLAAALWALA